MKNNIKILWPINPYESVPGIDKNIGNFLSRFLENEPEAIIQPVHVSQTGYRLWLDAIDAGKMLEYMEQIQTDCEAYLKGFPGIEVETPLVLENSKPSSGWGMSMLLEYLQKNPVDFLVLGATGKRGLEHMVLGSVTEHLVRQGQTPAFVIGQNTKSSMIHQRALVPIELNDESTAFAEYLISKHQLDFVKEIEFFHSVRIHDFEDVAWSVSQYNKERYDYTGMVDRATSVAHDFLEKLMVKLRIMTSKKLSFSVDVQKGWLSETIERHAEAREASLIVMHSTTRPTVDFFIGSHTKKVMRDATVPTLVFPFRHKK